MNRGVCYISFFYKTLEEIIEFLGCLIMSAMEMEVIWAYNVAKNPRVGTTETIRKQKEHDRKRAVSNLCGEWKPSARVL